MEYSNYDQFCPRCRRHGAPNKLEIYAPGPVEIGKNVQETLYVYPCGSVFNGTQGTFDEIKCEFKHITPEEALHEAELVEWTMRNPNILHNYGGDIGHFDNLTNIITDTKYLLWDANVLMSVFRNADTFLGTAVEFGQTMKQIWVIDPAMVTSDNEMVIGTFFFADKGYVGLIQLLQPLEGWPDKPPHVVWRTPYKCGQPVDNIEQAQAVAVYTWLQQPYVVQSEAITHSRQVRREAERKNKKLGNISVIEFRRPEGYKPPKQAKEKTRELHCCFERAGYTRRQPYGPKNSLRKVQWIAPTFVGDPEKPFKPKGSKIYRVSK